MQVALYPGVQGGGGEGEKKNFSTPRMPHAGGCKSRSGYGQFALHSSHKSSLVDMIYSKILNHNYYCWHVEVHLESTKMASGNTKQSECRSPSQRYGSLDRDRRRKPRG